MVAAREIILAIELHPGDVVVNSATAVLIGGGIFSSAGISPQPSLPTESVRYLPTLPVELPSPSGKRVDLEFSSSREDSHALAAITTVFAKARFFVRVVLPV